MRAIMPPLCLAILLSTAGCSTTAPKGQGGFAEHDYSRDASSDDDYINNYSESQSHPIGLENALYFEQQLSKRHLDSLIIAGANICFPATVKTAKIRQARISRELQGGLKEDAANDLIIQRDQLNRLERRLNYVQMQESCLPSSSANTATLSDASNASQANNLTAEKLAYISTLLNNNNQFVVNSSELNPRYIGQLSEASQLLRDHPQYHLKLTGHSDKTGNSERNLKLSIARATQVERYLLIFGFNPNNISVHGSGEKEPLFTQDKAPARLVNRRVSIELFEQSPSLEVMPL
ncbi:OmpA family protein [Psychromonas sp. psych-6C06]|uniref:OmpA family protein n=1 Tax=Psychromonas sp. psych-6C06 TaxID=2058089 RepID=UPI000C320FD3|nr:OmpA family protein [Psychromonas sp. psych-6C06]PKF62493.1 OmpA family protein [Psychromonas sp. psych-6C06]